MTNYFINNHIFHFTNNYYQLVLHKRSLKKQKHSITLIIAMQNGKKEKVKN